MTDVTLVLHGWGGNKPEHWQDHLVASLRESGDDVRYPKFPNPAEPALLDWLSTLQTELAAIPAESKLTVLAHSLSSILWFHYSASLPANAAHIQAERVLLVAPPYVMREILPQDTPPSVADFFPPPMSPVGIRLAAVETDIVASDTDDFATFDQTAGYAVRLDIPIHKLAGAGHISPYYGYGKWPWVTDWTRRRAQLPPLPNT